MPRPDPLTEAVDLVAARQWGLVTRDQLVAAGLARPEIAYRVNTGRLVRVRGNVYRVPGSPVVWEQRLLAALLAGPEDAVASHLAAARLWGLRGLSTDALEITARPRCRLAGVIAHQTELLPPADRGQRAGIPLTSVARTFCDLAGAVPVAALARALDEALRAEQLTMSSLGRCVDRLVSLRDGRGIQPIATLLEARRRGPALGDSPLEGQALRWLREAGLPDPVTQHRVVVDGHHYRLDLAYPDLRIGIELLGWYEHGKRSAFEPDLTRRNRFEVAAWLVLEFGDRHSREEFVGTVLAARHHQLGRLDELARLAGPA